MEVEVTQDYVVLFLDTEPSIGQACREVKLE